MIGRTALRRCFISLILLLVGTSFALAQPFTRRSSQEKHDGLKKYYEISNFKLGGKYDLANPSKWENGGEGGVTLESLGGGKLRTAYIAVGTPRRNAAGEITNAIVISSYYSGDSTDMLSRFRETTASFSATCSRLRRLIRRTVVSTIASAVNRCSVPFSSPKMSPARWNAPIWRRPSESNL